MTTPDDTLLARVLGDLLRAPAPVRELEVERSLARLQAARGDAAYLLLHRVLVLEAALLQLRQRAAAAAPAGEAAQVQSAAQGAAVPRAPGLQAQPAPSLPRSVLRDAAAVAMGVVAGQAVWDGLAGDGAAAAAADAVAGADLGSALDGWLG